MKRFSSESFFRRGMRWQPADVRMLEPFSDRTSRSGNKATILAMRSVLSSPNQQLPIISFLRSPCMWFRNSRISATSLRSRMISECNAGAALSTCKGVFTQHFILSINTINSMNTLYNACIFHKLKIQIFMDVTHPRLFDAEGTGSTFLQNVCIY